tara:strand:- start:5742 stop:7301 length:1560 start_codon:yes stop_codon:yes gene_type:complete
MSKLNDNLREILEKYGVKIIIAVLTIVFLLYILNKINIQKNNCETISKNTKDLTFYTFNKLRNANYFKTGESGSYTCKLKDFYFKSAYNCFCSGNLSNDYIDLCALKNCSESGVRFLDMQVFSMNNVPIIAVNHDDNLYQKDSYNSITFKKGIKEINDQFIIDSDVKEFPLFLHLRLNYGNKNNDSTNKIKSFYKQIHDTIIEEFNDTSKLFTMNQRSFYTDYEDNRESIIANLPIDQCEGKIFIFVTLNHSDNTNNTDFLDSELNNITDLLSTVEQSIAVLRSDEIVDDQYISFQGLTKRKMVVSLPELKTVSSKNYDFSNAAVNGVQFICMNFQKSDNMLQLYDGFFKSQIGSSSQNASSVMIKKPDILLNTTVKDESFFVPNLLYQIYVDNNYCDVSTNNANNKNIIYCDKTLDETVELYNIYKYPYDKDGYYFKSFTQDRICDISSVDNKIYCDLDDFNPKKSSIFKFSRVGADQYKITDVDGSYCALDETSNDLSCDVFTSNARATIFNIKKTT